MTHPGLRFEARIQALRKSRDKSGADWCLITLQVHPSDAQPMFLLPLAAQVDVTVQIAEPPAEKPVAPATAPEKRPFKELPRSQQAGILCEDHKFAAWLKTTDAAHEVRTRCGVTSRANLDPPDNWPAAAFYQPAAVFDEIVKSYRDHQAEQRILEQRNE